MSKKRRKTTGGPSRSRRRKAKVQIRARDGRQAFDRGDYETAIKIWEPMRNAAGIKAALAEAYFRQGIQLRDVDSETAYLYIDEAAKLNPDDALYAYHAGLVRHKTGDLDTAIIHYQDTLKRDSNFARVYYPWALALSEQERPVPENILAELSTTERALLAGQPSNDDYVSKILAHARASEWDQVMPAFDAREIDLTSDAMARYYLGVAAQREDQFEAAREFWFQAYDLGVRSPHLTDNVTLAATLSAEASIIVSDLDDALKWAELGLRIDPSHTRLNDIHTHIKLLIGYDHAEQGNWNMAIDIWESAEEASGADARDLAANLAIAYEQMEWWEDAADAWRDFARRRPRKKSSTGWLSPEQVARLWARVSALYSRSGETEEAVNTLKNAINHDPDNPILGQALAHAYMNNNQPEAGHNQIDRVIAKLKKGDDHYAEALTLKAQIVEAAPQGWFFRWDVPGIREWQRVLEAGDETYASLARQRLGKLYAEAFEQRMRWGLFDQALTYAQQALDYAPNDPAIRSRYIYALIYLEVDEDEIQEEIAKIDLSNPESVNRLIAVLNETERHAEAEAILEKAENLKPLSPEVYVVMGHNAILSDQQDTAQSYFDKALCRVETDEQRLDIRAQIGLVYRETGQDKEAERIWKDILKDAPDFAMVHMYLAMLYAHQRKKRLANRHIDKLEQVAKRTGDTAKLEMVEQLRLMLASPLGKLMSRLPIFDPNFDPMMMSPEELDDLFDDLDYDEFDEFMSFAAGMMDEDDDFFDDYDDDPPTRRSRRKKR